jgi:hypothetical protein
MAIVGINITSFVISLVRTRQLQNFLYTYGTTKEVYQEFYCELFAYFFTHFHLTFFEQQAMYSMSLKKNGHRIRHLSQSWILAEFSKASRVRSRDFF